VATRALCAPCPRTPYPVLCALCPSSSSSFPPPHPMRRALCLVAIPSVWAGLHQLHITCVSPGPLDPCPPGTRTCHLWLCCFAGVNFFGTIEGFEPHYGFSTFGLSLNSLFRVCTRISWEDIMYKVRWHWVHEHAVGHPMLELGAVLPHL
jgi:hypothetical protein